MSIDDVFCSLMTLVKVVSVFREQRHFEVGYLVTGYDVYHEGILILVLVLVVSEAILNEK